MTRAPESRAGAAAPAHRGGFTLIEVMITMFVIAIGLLSAAGLQTMSKKVHFDAVQRTSASQLAQSMVERLRANPGQLAQYVTTDAGTVSAAVDCGASGAQCSATDLVSYDLAAWGKSMKGVEERIDADNQNAGGLSNPTGCIAQGAQSGEYLVAVTWRGVTGLDPPDATVPATDPLRNTCGQGLGRYDDPVKSGVDDRMRRIVVLDVYISS